MIRAIARDAVVTIDYRLTDDEGELIDESGATPLIYLHGHGNLVVGLERALEGLAAGAEATVRVAPADGYGAHDPEDVIRIARDALPGDVAPEVGMEIGAENEDGSETTFWIAAVEPDGIVLDANHPLAGVPLNFWVAVRTVRAASPDELASGVPEETAADAPKM